MNYLTPIHLKYLRHRYCDCKRRNFMVKKVSYNGGTESYYNCSNPSVLVVGQVYTVIKEDVYAWQTDYTLEGFYGKFNASWFDDVTDN